MNSHEKRKWMIRRRKVIVAYLLCKRSFESREHCRSIFTQMQKDLHGFQSSLIPRLRNEYPELYLNYTRMSGEQFDYLLSLVGNKLQKKNTKFRKAIPASDRLLICLRFLATGANFTDLSMAYRIGKSTVCGIIQETCLILFQELNRRYVGCPQTVEEWEAIAVGFQYQWNFPNCVGAIDGKHVALKAPPASGSLYFNYKKYSSIVLMAACDARYAFTFLDAGNYGRISDGGVFGNCELGRALSQEPSRILPSPNTLPGSDVTLPYVFVADEAFPLRLNLLRPYSSKNLTEERRIFNYRLSRSRRCIENAFGILSSRWRVLLTTMSLAPENATMVTLACCCLHNFLIKEEFGRVAKTYCPNNFADTTNRDGSLREGLWRQEQQRLKSICRQGGNNSKLLSVQVRNAYANYFSNEGSVPFQYDL